MPGRRAERQPPPTLREARDRGRAGTTWSPTRRTRPSSAAWRSLRRGQAAVPARRWEAPGPPGEGTAAARPPLGHLAWAAAQAGQLPGAGERRLRRGQRAGEGARRREARRGTHVLRVPLIDGGQRRPSGHLVGRSGAAPGAPKGRPPALLGRGGGRRLLPPAAGRSRRDAGLLPRCRPR